MSELDYDRTEGIDDTIQVIKRSENIDPVVVRLTFFTFDQFQAAGLSLPTTALPNLDDINPAECKFPL